MSDIAASVELISGVQIDIIMPRAHNYSRAMRKYNNKNEFDLSFFLIEELCLINGGKKDLDFYKNMYCDDYLKIAEVLGNVITVIK